MSAKESVSWRLLDQHFGPDARDERNNEFRVGAHWQALRLRATPTMARSWRCGPVLDQGQTGHCGGFGAADEAAASPVRVRVAGTDRWAHAFYYEIKDRQLDPWGREDGTSVQAVMKLGQIRGLWESYLWAKNLDELDAGLDIGPAVVGTTWRTGMFAPDAYGHISPTGVDAGGHCYVVKAKLIHPRFGRCYSIRNSWGHGWGEGGNALMRREEFGELAFGGDGEVAFPVGRELPKAG